MAEASFAGEKNAAICNGWEFKAKWGVSKTKDKSTDFWQNWEWQILCWKMHGKKQPKTNGRQDTNKYHSKD